MRKGRRRLGAGARQWLVQRRRIGRVIRELEPASIRCSGVSAFT